MKASVHIGPNYTENLEVYSEDLKILFEITQRLILEHEAEILKVSPIDWTSPSWTISVLTHDQLINWTKPKVHVYSDSVLCLGTSPTLSASRTPCTSRYILLRTSKVPVPDPWPFWLKPFPVRTCAVVFSCVTSFSGFVLSKCLQPSFVVHHLLSWRVLMMGPMCLSLLCLVPLPNGSGPDLDGMGHCSFDAQVKGLRDIVTTRARIRRCRQPREDH